MIDLEKFKRNAPKKNQVTYLYSKEFNEIISALRAAKLIAEQSIGYESSRRLKEWLNAYFPEATHET